jgi:U3 small nucleolar RNA-associated protein 6
MFSQRAIADWTEDERFSIRCRERDVIVVNTRLWFHRTRIPAQRCPSVSFARDFRFDSGKAEEDGNGEATSGALSNVDGLYAKTNIEEGTIIFTETDMPHAELHVSSSDPNCRVVLLDDGSSAVVSTRIINAGEFFCVPDSESDSDEDEGEDDADDGDSEAPGIFQ